MDLDKLWDLVLTDMRREISYSAFHICFTNTRLISLEDKVVTIGFSNIIVRFMVEKRYYLLLKLTLDRHVQNDVTLVFVDIPRT